MKIMKTTQSPAMDDTTEPENQPVLVSVASIHKKWKRKTTRLVEEDEAGPPPVGEVAAAATEVSQGFEL